MNAVQPIKDPEKIKEMKFRLAQASSRDLLLFSLGINTGLRISDLLALKVGDVKGREWIEIKEKKTGKIKRVMLHAVLADIESHVEGKSDSEYLFASRKGGHPLSRVQAYRILNKAAHDCGVKDFGPESLRKTFGYHFFQATQNVALLQQLFGHAAPGITLRYIGVMRDEMKEEWGRFSL